MFIYFGDFSIMLCSPFGPHIATGLSRRTLSMIIKFEIPSIQISTRNSRLKTMFPGYVFILLCDQRLLEPDRDYKVVAIRRKLMHQNQLSTTWFILFEPFCKISLFRTGQHRLNTPMLYYTFAEVGVFSVANIAR